MNVFFSLHIYEVKLTICAEMCSYGNGFIGLLYIENNRMKYNKINTHHECVIVKCKQKSAEKRSKRLLIKKSNEGKNTRKSLGIGKKCTSITHHIALSKFNSGFKYLSGRCHCCRYRHPFYMCILYTQYLL